ncbi:GNAT family N-acetyltransferase [Siansivirga zeaxanthinifaciens]|uniref:GNAT family acetyltransferase n=1 Tax=Siansivirga zeaxanthinifaciens CC-SAMT-1 TaxID=1454006 RepID=A0A0C5VUZ5_9FLAO|nr:GNAT family N-acetyltransferase [Siansivirga zeaxanthinifaciens]AJR02971.1 GNAT family acetyltransferase [Siansivirga zeaxanthinifaciens CC-SAMT-1]
MDFNIRKAVKMDMPQVLSLINQLAIYEKEPDAVEITLQDLENDGFGDNPAFFCFVAEKNNKIEGIALCYFRYSTWKGKTLHLEDLIVNETMRGTGMGTALLNEVIKYGHNLGVKRINWEVLDWNEPAVNFYKKKGAHILDEWRVVHLNEKGIENYMANI